MACIAAVAAVASGLSAAAARGSGTDLSVAYQIDIAHSGVQNDSTLIPPVAQGFQSTLLFQHWHTTLPAQTSYPLIANGDVYVTVGDNNSSTRALYALAQQDGHVVWSRTIPDRTPWSGLAYDAGRIFVVTNDPVTSNDDGLMLSFDAQTGTLLWTVGLPGESSFFSPPTAANGVVYTSGGGFGGKLYAVGEATGSVLATASSFGGLGNGSPVVSTDSVFVSNDCDAYGFTQATLAVLWHDSACRGGGSGKTQVYSNGQLFDRDYQDGSFIIDAATGNLIRSFAPPNTAIPAPAVDSNTMFVLLGGRLTAEDRTTGAIKWANALDGFLDTAPIVIANQENEVVIEGSGTGQLYARDGATGFPVWSALLPAAIPGGDEINGSQPLTGLAAGQGLLVVPTGKTLTAFGPPVPCPPSGGRVNTRWHYTANGSTGGWSLTKPTDCGTGSVTSDPQAMDGYLELTPGTRIKTGYAFTLPGNKRPFMADVTHARVIFRLRCVSRQPASPSELTVAMTNRTYPIAGSEWEPTADNVSPVGYQGSATVPDACSGSRVRLDKGGTFSARILLRWSDPN